MRLTVLPTSKSRKSAVPLYGVAKPESNQEFAKAETFTERGRRRVRDQHAGGPGVRREPRRKRRTVRGAPPTAWEIASAGHTPHPSTESGDVANEKLQTAFFGYQSSQSHRYLRIELSPIQAQ